MMMGILTNSYVLAIATAILTAALATAYGRFRDPESVVLPNFARVAIIGSVVGLALTWVHSARSAPDEPFDGDYEDF